MGSNGDVLKLGAAQIAEVYLDTAATIEKDCEYIRRAGDADLDLLVFPEFHIARPTWYRYDNRGFKEYYRRVFEEAVTVPGPEIDRLCDAAADAETAVVIGVTEKEPDSEGTMYNSLVFIDGSGTLLGTRRKLVPTMHERLFHAAGTGDDVRVFNSEVGTLGGMMCGEHTNHLLGFAVLGMGERLHAAAWPAFPWLDSEERRERVGLRTRFHAYTGKVPTALATGTVTEELAADLDSDVSTAAGASAVIGPDGSYLAGPKLTGEGIVSAEVNMNDRIEGKALHDVVGHYNRFDIFDLRVNRGRPKPVTVVGDEGRDGAVSRGVDSTAPGDLQEAIRVLREHIDEDEAAQKLLDGLSAEWGTQATSDPN